MQVVWSLMRYLLHLWHDALCSKRIFWQLTCVTKRDNKNIALQFNLIYSQELTASIDHDNKNFDLISRYKCVVEKPGILHYLFVTYALQVFEFLSLSLLNMLIDYTTHTLRYMSYVNGESQNKWKNNNKKCFPFIYKCTYWKKCHKSVQRPAIDCFLFVCSALLWWGWVRGVVYSHRY